MQTGPTLAHRLALAAGIATTVGGAAGCLAWLAGVPDLTRLLATSSTMHFNTGLLFAVAGAGLAAGVAGHRRWAAAGSGIVILGGTLVLAQYLAGVDLGLDDLFVRAPAGVADGHVAPNTAVTFVLAGLAMLFLAATRRLPWASGIVQMLSALVMAMGLVALVGYAVDFTAAFQWAGFTRMAAYTAACFVVLGVALALAGVDASHARHWHEVPWLAATAGAGVAALSALAWYALRSAPSAGEAHLADIVMLFGLLTAALVAGAVAQARHLRQQAHEVARANTALRESEGRLQSLLDSLQTAVVVHGADTGIRYVNPAAVQILGLSRDQLLGKTTIDPYWHFVREDGQPMPVSQYPVSVALERKAALHDYLVGVRAAPDEPTRWALVNAIPDFAPDGAVRQVVVSFVDISERRRQAQQLEEQALTDSLTGLATRRHFLAEAEREIGRARRGHPLSLLVLDVDHFKSINDTHGHAAGDRTLTRLAAAVRAILREADLAGRLGGEEFGVLLPDTDDGVARAIAERLRTVIASAPVPLDGDGELRVTASIGVATLERDRDIDAFIARADQAMYRAKRSGRNRVEQAQRAAA